MLSNAIYCLAFPLLYYVKQTGFKKQCTLLDFDDCFICQIQATSKKCASIWSSFSDLNKRKQFHQSTKRKSSKTALLLAWRFLCLEGLEINLSKSKPSLGCLFLFGDSSQSHGYVPMGWCQEDICVALVLGM